MKNKVISINQSCNNFPSGTLSEMVFGMQNTGNKILNSTNKKKKSFKREKNSILSMTNFYLKHEFENSKTYLGNSIYDVFTVIKKKENLLKQKNFIKALSNLQKKDKKIIGPPDSILEFENSGDKYNNIRKFKKTNIKVYKIFNKDKLSNFSFDINTNKIEIEVKNLDNVNSFCISNKKEIKSKFDDANKSVCVFRDEKSNFSIRLENTNEKLDLSYSNKTNNNCKELNIMNTENNINKNLNFSCISYQINPELSNIFDIEFVKQLIEKDSEYSDLFISNLDQTLNIKETFIYNRAKILDLQIQVSEEFGFKRDTYYMAVTYYDRYLSCFPNMLDLYTNYSNIPTLKLIALCCLMIASKIEEIQIPRSEEYINVLNSEGKNTFSQEIITKTEIVILKKLKWKLHPITLNTWMNWYVGQWDLFYSSFYEDKIMTDLLFFKKTDDKSYYLFKKISQLIDLISLDFIFVFICKRKLVAISILICILENNFSINEGDIETDNLEISNFNDEEFLINVILKGNDNIDLRGFISIFIDFLNQSFNMKIEELLSDLPKITKYIGFLKKISVDLPITIQMASDDDEMINNVSFFI